MRDRWEYDSRIMPQQFDAQLAELNRLGADGWEFIQTFDGPLGSLYALLKRRVIPEEDVR